MIIENLALPPARKRAVAGSKTPSAKNARDQALAIPFDTLEVGQAFQVDLSKSNSADPYNLLKQRVYRACVRGKRFVSRRIDGNTYVFRTV